MGKTVPCAYALLPSGEKEKMCYARLATAIKQEMDKLEVANQVKIIMMDYERGLIEAFKTTFEDVLIAGCDFYLEVLHQEEYCWRWPTATVQQRHSV